MESPTDRSSSPNIAINGRQPRVGHGKIRIQFNGVLEQRNGFGFALRYCASRRPRHTPSTLQVTTWSPPSPACRTSESTPATRPAFPRRLDAAFPLPGAPPLWSQQSPAPWPSESPVAQLVASSATTYWLPSVAIEPLSMALMCCRSQISRATFPDSLVRRTSHELQRFADGLIGHDVQIRRLLELHCQRLLQRAIETQDHPWC